MIARFEVIGEIARGGMGVVAKAWDPQIGRYVAIKFLHEALQTDEAMVRQFETEAQINGRLEHPAIVSVHEKGRSETGRPYFVMRLLEGNTLARLLARRLNTEEHQITMLRIFEKVCDGMAFAHAHGVIHRDLKPSNIIVGDFGMVKIMDWGLAMELDRKPPVGEDDGCGLIVGTPAFLAPEQARGETQRVDEHVDVFALGGILCQILTGVVPYAAEHPSKLEQAIHARLEPALARLNACHAEGELVKLAKNCLSPEPKHRPSDARAVAAAITGYLESNLRRTEREIVRFFELALDFFCIAGLDGYFRRINPNFSRLLGYTDTQMLTKPFADFVHPDDLGPTAEVMSKLSVGLPVIQFTNRYRHADGHYLSLEWVARPDFEGNGTIYAVARNVSNRMGAQPSPPAQKKAAGVAPCCHDD
jgi:serine/threonine-protein kinase